MPFLGLVYDTVKMSIEVPQDELDSITLLVGTWMNTSSAMKTTLQSLIGKLALSPLVTVRATFLCNAC